MHSFAQHGEDLKILQLLGGGDVLRSPGFYIDIGAWHPTADSVTKLFYDAGWRGINIEPQPAYFTELVIERPRDVNLPYGVSDTGGGVRHPFTQIDGSGLSTFHPRWSAQWSSNSASTKLSVPVYTLEEICNEHVPTVYEGHPVYQAMPIEIDFLKIDVEGWEQAVIKGADWTRYRPKLLCIEATEPGTDIPAWDGWEHLLFEAGYEFIEMAAVNRYYLDTRA